MLKEPYAFTTENLSDIAYDTSTDLAATRNHSASWAWALHMHFEKKTGST